MLISFTFQNWMSFKGESYFHTIADDDYNLNKLKLYHLEKYKTDIIPTSVIYGANASGKSNFFKALAFVKEFITQITLNNTIEVKPYIFDEETEHGESYFAVLLYVNGQMYHYEFVITKTEVIRETMVKIYLDDYTVIYNRENGAITFDASLERQDHLQLIFRITRRSQLFLQACRINNRNDFDEVYNWFADKLEIILPNQTLMPILPYFKDDHPLHQEITKILSDLDTGIEDLTAVKQTAGNSGLFLPISDVFKFMGTLQEGSFYRCFNPDNAQRMIIAKENGKMYLYNIGAVHTTKQGRTKIIELSQESEGVNRLFELLPIFAPGNLENKGKTYLIDELDRSLHPIVVAALLELFFEHCDNSDGQQLIFSCNDVQLFDQYYLRKDQFWLVENDKDAGSKIFNIREYRQTKDDKALRKSYLTGNLGGIPHIGTIGLLDVSPCPEP